MESASCGKKKSLLLLFVLVLLLLKSSFWLWCRCFCYNVLTYAVLSVVKLLLGGFYDVAFLVVELVSCCCFLCTHTSEPR